MTNTRIIALFIQTIITVLLVPNALAQLPVWEWARSANSGGFEIAYDVDVDPATNDVYIAGDWSNDLSAIFPAGANPSTDFSSTYGGDDGFVAKYDEDGNFIWAFKVGGNNNDGISAISVDPSGDFYITGTFEKGTAFFSGTSAITGASTITNADKTDFFIAKYDSAGAFQWIRRSDTDSEDNTGIDVCTNSTDVFAAGTYKSLCTFGPLSITTTYGNEDIFLVKYDGDGNEQWLIHGGSDNQDFANAVSADETSVYLAGNFKGASMELTNTAGTTVSTLLNVNSGKEDIFLAAYDSDGSFNWSQRISSNDEDECHDLTLDSDSIYMTGAISTLANFPAYSGNPVIASANRDIFISSHSKLNGNTGWALSIPCTDGGDEYGLSITRDDTDDLFITGYFKNDLSFPDALILSSAGAEDVFIAAYSSEGIFEWATIAGSNGKDIGYGISAGSGGSIFAAGSYDHLISLGPLTLPDDGSDNAFLVKLLEPCKDANGGTLSAGVNELCQGDSTLLKLQGFYGEINWQESPAGMDTWTDIPDESSDSIFVTPLVHSDYRAFLTSGTCNPDSSNIETVMVYVVPDANAGPGGVTCGNTFGLQAVLSTGTGQWSKKSGPGTATYIPSENDPIVIVIVDQYGTYEFTWTETNVLCSDDSSLTVTFFEPPIINPGSGGDICGLSYNLNAIASVGNGQWSKTAGPGSATYFPSDTVPNPLVTVSQYGNYSFTWVEVNGPCSPGATIFVNFYKQPDADPGPGGEICGLTFSLNATPSAGAGIWTLKSGPGIAAFLPSEFNSNANAVVSDYGTYGFDWTENNGGCSDDSTVTVTYTEPPVSVAGLDAEICISDGNYPLSGSTSANGTILWITSGDGSFNDNTIDNPTYTLGTETDSVILIKTVVSPGSCLDAVDSMILSLTPVPISDAGTDAEICASTGNFSISGSTSSNGSIVWTSVGDGSFNDNTIDNPTYTIGTETDSAVLIKTVTSPGSCPAVVDSMILTLTLDPQSDAGPNAEICITDGNFPVSGSTSANGSILWTSSRDGSFNNDTIDNPTYILGTETDSVILIKTVVSPGTCPDAVDSMILTLTPIPTVDAGPDAEICIIDGSFSLVGASSANGTILWTSSGDGSFDNDTIDNSTYTLGTETDSVILIKTVISTGSCPDAVDSMILTLTHIPTVDAGLDAEICTSDGTFTVSGSISSNGNILWTGNGDGSFDNDTIDNPSYTLGTETDSVILIKTVTSPGSCPDAVDSMILSLIPASISDAGPDGEICISDGSFIVAGTSSANGTILWTSSGDGSFDSDNIDNPTYNLGTETDSVILIKTVASPGLCADAVDSMVLTITPIPTVDAGPDGEICTGDGSFSVSGSTSANGSILWTSSGDGSFDNNTIDNPTYTLGTETDSVILIKAVTSPGSCPDAVDSMILTLIPAPVSDAGPDGEICTSDGSFVITGSTSANGTILWTSSGDGSFDDNTLDNPTYNPGTETDSVILIKTVASPGLCAEAVDSMVLTLTPIPTVDAGPDGEICTSDGSFIVSGSTSANGIILWTSSGNGSFDDHTTDNPTYDLGTDTDSVILIKTVTSPGSCSDVVDSMILTVIPTPEAIAGQGGRTCELDFQLDAEAGEWAGEWTKTSGPGTATFNPSPDDPGALAIVSEFGQYVFTWTVSNGLCSDTSSVIVNFVEMIEVNAGVGGSVCGLIFDLNAVPGNGSGLWTVASGPGVVTFTPSDTNFNASATVDRFGTYTFQWNESEGNCHGTDSVEVSFFKQPVADAGPDQVLESVFTTILEANIPEFGTGWWTLLRGSGQLEDENDPGTQVTGLLSGENEFIWSIVNGVCEENSDSVVVTVNDSGFPTVITPNNDGFNDFLEFPGIDLGSGSELIIYNRWGTEVYRISGYQNDWDGRDQKGRELISDTYYYVLKLHSSRIIKSFVEIRR